MIGWIIAAVLIGLLLTMKVGIFVSWENETAKLKVRVGILRFAVSTAKKEKPEKKGQSKDTAATEQKNKKLVLKMWVRALLANWHDVLQLIGKILRTPELDLLRIRVDVGAEDPEACALRYGRLCAGFGAILPVIQNILPPKKQDVNIQCSFDKSETEVLAEAEATLRICEAVAILISAFTLLITLYRHTKQSEKAVQSL